MKTTFRTPALSLFLFACGSDDEVKASNTAPSVEITSPNISDAYYFDRLILFSAIINDAEDAPAALMYTWRSSIDGDLELYSSPDSDGGIEGYLALSAGQHTLSLRVEDTSGEATSETVDITVAGPN